MDELPLEIIVHILQYLSKEEQIKVSILSKKFREAVFSPTLWSEHDKRIEVSANQLKSFRKFLKQTPWLKHLNLLLRVSKNGRSSTVNLTSVFKSLYNLECVSLQLHDCSISTKFFPSTLKHISLVDCGPLENRTFITDDIVMRIADSCSQLEQIQIKVVESRRRFCRLLTQNGLTYLLKKVNGTLKILILSLPSFSNLFFNVLDCPPNLTTLCLNVIRMVEYSNHELLELPNLENLQILSLNGQPCPTEFDYSKIFVNSSLTNLRFLYIAWSFSFYEDQFHENFTKLPNLQVLYLDNCLVNIDILVRSIKASNSLKVLVWKMDEGYFEHQLLDVEELSKETQLKIYLCSSYGKTKCWFHKLPSFPNETVDCLKTFNHLMLYDIFDEDSSSFFQCHSPIIKKSKAILAK